MVSTHVIQKYDAQRYVKAILINLLFSGKIIFLIKFEFRKIQVQARITFEFKNKSFF
jgi:hypothetical protein